MKKFTLFAALLVAGMATAQVQSVMTDINVKDMQLKSIDVEKTIDREKFTAESYANRFAKKANAANANYNGIDYYSVDGMMHAGITLAGQMYIPIILLPYQDVTVWENRVMPFATESWKITEAPTTWNVDGQVTENSQTCEAMYEPLLFSDLYLLPVTNDHTVLLNDASLEIKGYQYGAGEANKFLACAPVAGQFVEGGNLPMTLCGMYCDPSLDDTGAGDTRDWWVVGAGAYGDYSIGTGLNIEGKSIDTIGSIVRNVSPMKIEQLDIMVCDKTNQGGAYMFPEGASIKVEIFPADLTAGLINTTEPLYTTTMTIDDYTEFNVQLGMISAKFYKEDIFGGLTQEPIVLDGDFYVQFTNFNESGCRFGFMSDYATPGGTTLYTWDGEFTTLWTDGGANMLINFDAYWPAIMYGGASDVLVAPIEGGYAMDVTEDGEFSAVALFSTVLDFENWGEVEAPDWIEVVLDESALSTKGYVVAQFTAAALPAGETGRTGIVTVDADGGKLDIVINQGEVVNTGVENVVAPEFNGKTYNLLGVEVDETYKGIVIKNGQKYIQ